MPTWEYKITGWVNETELNRLGADGWEWVAIDSGWEHFIFKRPLMGFA